MKKRAACYCRVSTKKDDQLDSLEKQREFFERFFSGNSEYELYRLYADEGISAKSMRNRRAFQQMLIDAKQGRFDALFVKDVSRFARNVQDFYRALEVLEGSGVRVHFVTMGLRSEEASRFTLGLMALLAEDESERLSVKVKFGKNVTAQRGRVPNAVFGYDRLDAFTLRPHPAEAEWVRRIFSMYARNGMSAAAIAQALNREGVASRRGNTGSWTQSSVCKLLKNPLYTGRVGNKKSEVVDFRTGRRKTYPSEDWVVVVREDFRIVGDDIFEEAQRLLRERAGGFRAGSRQSGAHPLSNLMRCALDGRCMRRIQRGGSAKWVCSVRNAQGVSACANASRIPEEGAEALLEGLALAALRSDPASGERIERRARKLILESCGGDNPGREKALRDKARRLRALYAEGMLSLEELREELIPVEAALERARGEARAKEKFAECCIQIPELAKMYSEGRHTFADNAFLKRWLEAVEVDEAGEMRLILRSGAALDVK